MTLKPGKPGICKKIGKLEKSQGILKFCQKCGKSQGILTCLILAVCILVYTGLLQDRFNKILNIGLVV